MKASYLAIAVVTFLGITACGGGSTVSTTTEDNNQGSADAADLTDNDSSSDAASQQQGALLTGRFVDSAVSGMAYQTDSRQGTTNSDGEFQYQAGESVVFSIGDVTLPAVAGAELVTPLSVFSTDMIGDPRVINLVRLLQSLDVDANVDNGIEISDVAIASASGLDLDFASADFENDSINLVANSGSVNTMLIDGEQALGHFQETLFVEGVMERPSEPSGNVETDNNTPDSTDSATHPAVGTVVELSTLSHRVTGTVTIVDDRTLRVTNFNYDGGGPSVFFYTGVDGVYSSGRGGQIIGDMLNGRTYDNETITLTIPDNLTLDDFNGISVWCDIFNVSFGDAQF